MLPSNQGAFKLFRAFGIQVSLHWSWFLIAYWRYENGKDAYQHPVWMIWEIIGLFAIVLTHEFGHSLACLSVGGRADRIILWPLGGIAFVQPPMRPAPFLWSIAAGPLVNVALVPIFFLLRLFIAKNDLVPPGTDLAHFVETIWQINLILLIFNIMPIYPLDGGQIFQSVLWFFIGQARSILIAAGLGMVCGVAGAVYAALILHEWYLALMALFLVSQSWKSFQWARETQKAESDSGRNPVIDI